uniref:Saposin B-type domain-containing protein n=1 Tax=Plectus sambesii TaxID=2011161 RepID=A0A914WGY9_9BILA
MNALFFVFAIFAAAMVVTVQSERPQPGKEGAACTLCITLLSKGIDYCESATTEIAVKESLELFCQMIGGSVEAFCEQIVDNGIDYIWNAIQNGGTPDHEASQACSCIGLCPYQCPS